MRFVERKKMMESYRECLLCTMDCILYIIWDVRAGVGVEFSMGEKCYLGGCIQEIRSGFLFF